MIVAVMIVTLMTTGTFAADQRDDAEHLLYLADHGLAVIRFTIDIDGESQRELCRSCLEAICAEADRDQDGFLTGEEYDARVASHSVLQERQALMVRQPNATNRPNFNSAGKLPVNAVAAYLMRNAWPPLVLEFTAPQMRRISAAGELLDRPLADERMFDLLDTDGNRKLTSREFERAAEVLGRLDFDEDEIISLEELRMQPTPAVAAANANRRPRRSDFHLSHLTPDRIDAQFVRRILSLYDGEAKGTVQDLRLDRQEVGLSEEIFAKADADRDGFWDFDELWRFLEEPSAVAEIRINLVTGAATAAEFASLDPAAAKLLNQHPGVMTFELQGTRLQLLLPPSPRLDHGSDKFLQTEFQSLDDDKNEYLEPKEYPFGANDDEVSPIFRAMDADDDGKVYLKEYFEYSHNRQRARASQLVLNAENLQRTLFGPLDVNGDGRISQRELVQLQNLAAEWDADVDGKLIEDEIPQQYRLSLSHGSGRLAEMSGPMFLGDANPELPPGPLWFRKMDRNRDGEISPREFLGPVAQFEKIDGNGNGGIDATEAAAVK